MTECDGFIIYMKALRNYFILHLEFTNPVGWLVGCWLFDLLSAYVIAQFIFFVNKIFTF